MEVCMDSADWLQGVISHESGGMDSAISSPSGDNMLTCAASRPLMERRLRPQQDQALKCPRCDSTHTKFCYYNNYSLSQPRYFCKTCRRYWTKGGTLRNIPVGGGCRKNKKVAAKKSTSNNSDHSMMNQHNNLVTGASSSSPIHGSTDLHLSFPEVQLSHLYGTLGTVPPSSYLDSTYPRPIDFMESKFDQTVVDGSRSSIQNFMGNNIGLGDMSGTFQPGNFNGLMMGPSSFGISSSPPPPIDGNMDTCQRLMLPYDYHAYEEDHHHHHDDNDGSAIDVKPINTKLVPFDWQDHHHQQQQQHHHNQNQSCLNGVGPWSGLMHPYGPSTTNPLV